MAFRNEAPTFIIRLPDRNGRLGWRRGLGFRGILEARRAAEVMPLLAEADRLTGEGECLGGFLAYEAAPAFDGAFDVHAPKDLPLAWFARFETLAPLDRLPEPTEESDVDAGWEPDTDRATYRRAFDTIREYIAAGDTYQVNYTIRQTAACTGDPYAWFRKLCGCPPPLHAAYLAFGHHAILSLSPELFLQRDGERVISRPMKGTASRGRWWEEDEAAAARLAASEKDCAENAMIVDMIRNDLGRVARPGSVRVEDAFRVERHPTVLQMTSTVAAETDAPPSAVLAAAFPCASVTGAPKVRAMEIIRELEASPRGVYTGAIGCIGPGPAMHFNVAIRTIHADRRARTATYGVGGGIVWDSNAEGEYDECRLKTRILHDAASPFCLLETLLLRRGGYFLLGWHLERLRRSAAYFGFPFDAAEVQAKLTAQAAACGPGRFRVRLLVDAEGTVSTEAFSLPVERPRRVRRVALAAEAIDAGDPFLYHKTTRRDAYDAARAACPEADDVILYNERGEVTESCIANLVLRGEAGRLVTPPIACGLLPGTFRQRLLERGAVVEAVVSVEDLRRAEELWLVNSVRGWMPARLLSDG